MRLKILAILILLGFGYAQNKQDHFILHDTPGPAGINGIITDAETGEALPARIIIENREGESIDSYYNIYPGFYSEEDGTFVRELEPGAYTLTVTRGFDYLSQTHAIAIRENSRLQIEIALEPWVPLRELGWVNGDGHAHLYTDNHPDDAMLATVRKICRAQGIDFISTNQGWGGYNDDNWQEGYAKFSDEKFLLHYGAEMPKYRTGHTWWLGLKSCRHYFESTMDTVYENRYFQSPQGTSWDFNAQPFPHIPAVELIPRFKQAEGAAALIAHPTSWWWQKRGAIEKYTTNVCEHLAFSLLAGNIWDGMVVMGYDRDHYFYQNLWFHVLNEGYRLAPVAELDGGYGPNNKFPYGTMRVYYQAGKEVSMQNIVDAVKRGRTFVTSGPIVFADIDAHYQTGDIVPADGTTCQLNIAAYASGEVSDFLSYVIVFRNGAIHKLWDLRSQRIRTWKNHLKISETKRAWYAIKAYGSNAWHNPKNLDVMAVCDQILGGTFKEELHKENTICITSPFYFRPPGTGDPQPLQPMINLRLINPDTKYLIQNAQIDILLHGKKINRITVHNGHASFTMPVHAYLSIRCEGLPVIRRGLYLDYTPHRDLVENFANGRWLEKNNWKKIVSPGQVPWEAFQLKKSREILSTVDWTIEILPNERDALWEDFEALFPL
jgi:hypothetical protein